jgi:beta-glucosidase-like glycosyl hydrolase
VRAVRAGVDVVLIADDRLPGGASAADIVLESLRAAVDRRRIPVRRVAEALTRIEAMRARLP